MITSEHPATHRVVSGNSDQYRSRRAGHRLDMDSKKTYLWSMGAEDNKETPVSQDEETLQVWELVQRISKLAGDLRAAGGEAPAVVFALATVAADLAMDTSEDPLFVFPVLLDAIAYQAKRRMRAEGPADDADEDAEEEEVFAVPPGSILH